MGGIKGPLENHECDDGRGRWFALSPSVALLRISICATVTLWAEAVLMCSESGVKNNLYAVEYQTVVYFSYDKRSENAQFLAHGTQLSNKDEKAMS